MYWHCVDLFSIPHASGSAVFLSPTIVGLDICERPRSVLISRPPVVTFFNGLVLSGAAAARLVSLIAQIESASMSGRLFCICPFYGAKDIFRLDSKQCCTSAF